MNKIILFSLILATNSFAWALPSYEIKLKDYPPKYKTQTKSIKAQIVVKNKKDQEEVSTFINKSAKKLKINLSMFPDTFSPDTKLNLQAVGKTEAVNSFIKSISPKDTKPLTVIPKAQGN